MIDLVRRGQAGNDELRAYTDYVNYQDYENSYLESLA